MRIVIDNRQRLCRPERPALRALLAALADRAQYARRHQTPWRELTVILTDDAGMTLFNRAIMGHDGVTDVIAQRYDSLPGEPDGIRGEIIVNVERSRRSGPRRHGWSPAHELALYLAHGCDHLSGWDDATPSGRLRMRRRELRWLREIGLGGGRPLLAAAAGVTRWPL